MPIDPSHYMKSNRNIFASVGGWAEQRLAALKAARWKPAAYAFLTSCLGASGDAITAMTAAAEEVTREEMAACCDLNTWAKVMEYDSLGLPYQEDWHLTYWKSNFEGKPCYYVDHSRIEYIFVEAT
jgi:hypothetical protein